MYSQLRQYQCLNIPSLDKQQTPGLRNSKRLRISLDSGSPETLTSSQRSSLLLYKDTCIICNGNLKIDDRHPGKIITNIAFVNKNCVTCSI